MLYASSMRRELYKLPRVYCPNIKFLVDKIITLGDNNNQLSHYITTVLRMKSGYQIRVFNGCDGEYLCKLMNVSKGQSILSAEIIEKIKDKDEEIK
jgi:16S rRNA U1498 N3-methylase RsmE